MLVTSEVPRPDPGYERLFPDLSIAPNIGPRP